MSKSFRDLELLIENCDDEIVLDSDIVLGDGEGPIYLEGINLDCDIIIDGNGHSIDACGKVRIFYSSGELTIKNISLLNGYSDESGGAIVVDGGKMAIIDSIISGSYSAELRRIKQRNSVEQSIIGTV